MKSAARSARLTNLIALAIVVGPALLMAAAVHMAF